LLAMNLKAPQLSKLPALSFTTIASKLVPTETKKPLSRMK